jgi:hypothetical protein
MKPLKDEMKLVKLPQDRETDLSPFDGPGFSTRYAYLRSQDTRNYNDTGQDYLVFASNREKIAFCLCDGVSQSFYGDLAARFLGDNLLFWLWDLEPLAMEAAIIARALTTHLDYIKTQADQEVKSLPLPDNIPPMLREVLEQKRSIGSETTFVSGRLEMPSPALPGGRAFFSWMGDSYLRAWLHDRETSAALFHTFNTKQRWSTAKGLVNGPLNYYCGTLVEGGEPVFDHLIAYSDGLSTFNDVKQPLSDLALRETMVTAATLPTSDDISYLEILITP